MHTDIASLSLRELDAVALATNVMVFMGRDTIARTMHKFSTAAKKSSALPVLRLTESGLGKQVEENLDRLPGQNVCSMPE